MNDNPKKQHFTGRFNRSNCKCADCCTKRRSKGWQEWEKGLDYKICGDYEIFDPMTGLEMFCILPVDHSGDHDRRVDTGSWE
jgi:hypothetical protein